MPLFDYQICRIAVLGGVLAGFGGWFLKVSGDYKEILEFNQLLTPAVLVIIGGATIFLVAFLGLVGALKESRCLLMMYMVLVVLILLLEIGAVTVTFLYKDKVQEYVEDKLSKALKVSYGKDNEGPVTNAINDIQRTMKCCGAKNVNDYIGSYWANNTIKFPASCIDEDRHSSTKVNGTGDYPFEKGCVEKFREWGGDNLVRLGGIAAAVVAVELGGLICACIIYKGKSADVDVV
eukprot:gene11441-21643_t